MMFFVLWLIIYINITFKNYCDQVPIKITLLEDNVRCDELRDVFLEKILGAIIYDSNKPTIFLSHFNSTIIINHTLKKIEKLGNDHEKWLSFLKGI